MVDDESNRTFTVSPQAFGRRLREQREHHRITIEAIASSTKIKGSLLAGLERGDIAEWPAGIFQRAFVRAYARAVGLPPEPVVAEFLRVFGPDRAGPAGASPAGGELRLTLEPDGVSPFRTQALAALSEAVCIAGLAALTSWIAATGFGTTCGAFAFLYYPIAAAWLGCTPATWYLKREPTVVSQRRSDGRPAAAEKREGLYLVKPTGESERPAAGEEAGGLDSDSLRRRSAMR